MKKSSHAKIMAAHNERKMDSMDTLCLHLRLLTLTYLVSSTVLILIQSFFGTLVQSNPKEIILKV